MTKDMTELKRDNAHLQMLIGDGIQIERRLRIALEQCLIQFKFYEANHRAKTPPDNEKADVNAKYAELCEKALRPTTL